VKYWVLYKSRKNSSDHPEEEAIVTLDDLNGGLISDRLKQLVMPDVPGNKSEGLKPEKTTDCILLNWKKIS